MKESLVALDQLNSSADWAFALEANASVVIPAGTYTLRVWSDDGLKLTIRGVTFYNRVNNDFGPESPQDDTIQYYWARSPDSSTATFTVLEPLETEVTALYFDRNGDDVLKAEVKEGDGSGDSPWATIENGTYEWRVQSVVSRMPLPTWSPGGHDIGQVTMYALLTQASFGSIAQHPSAFVQAPPGTLGAGREVWRQPGVTHLAQTVKNA